MGMAKGHMGRRWSRIEQRRGPVSNISVSIQGAFPGQPGLPTLRIRHRRNEKASSFGD
jgi:hypothetical protein